MGRGVAHSFNRICVLLAHLFYCPRLHNRHAGSVLGRDTWVGLSVMILSVGCHPKWSSDLLQAQTRAVFRGVTGSYPLPRNYDGKNFDVSFSHCFHISVQWYFDVDQCMQTIDS